MNVYLNRKRNFSNVHTIPEEAIVGDVANEMTRINASLENRHDDHQESMVEIEGMIHNKPISILIDQGDILIYVSPSVVESCNLCLKKFEKSWLVQLATGTKIKVVSYVENCEMFMSQFKTPVKLNVLPLGSYDVLIGTDWLEKHIVVLNCFEKRFTCLDEKGEILIVK